MLTSRDVSSLVIDSLCDRARGQNVAVACFYFDFAAQKEQSSTSTLGALIKQVVSGLEEVPGEIAEAYEDQKKVIGGRGPQLSYIVEMLQTTLPKSVHSYASMAWMNVRQDVESSSWIRCIKYSKSLRALEYW